MVDIWGGITNISPENNEFYYSILFTVENRGDIHYVSLSCSDLAVGDSRTGRVGRACSNCQTQTETDASLAGCHFHWSAISTNFKLACPIWPRKRNGVWTQRHHMTPGCAVSERVVLVLLVLSWSFPLSCDSHAWYPWLITMATGWSPWLASSTGFWSRAKFQLGCWTAALRSVEGGVKYGYLDVSCHCE